MSHAAGVRATITFGRPTILLAETTEQAKLIGSPNQVDAVRANLEKRAPQFAG